MLFEIVALIIIVIMAVLLPVGAIIGFKKGYTLGVKDYNATHRDEMKTVTERRPKAVPGDSKELERLHTLLENVENYDGTSAHQQEID